MQFHMDLFQDMTQTWDGQDMTQTWDGICNHEGMLWGRVAWVSTFKGDNHIIKGNDIAFSNTFKQFLLYSALSCIQLEYGKQASIPDNPVTQLMPNFCIHVNIG